jgi:ABC-type multidrug transport system fused ATPase/permease subunit
MQGLMTVGDITAFLLFLVQLVANFLMFGGVMEGWMQMVGASYKIVDILEHKAKIPTTGGQEFPKDSVRGEI